MASVPSGDTASSGQKDKSKSCGERFRGVVKSLKHTRSPEPQYTFFARELADPVVLRELLGDPHLPEMRPAHLTGHDLISVPHCLLPVVVVGSGRVNGAATYVTSLEARSRLQRRMIESMGGAIEKVECVIMHDDWRDPLYANAKVYRYTGDRIEA